jgi:hypothetical protein
MDQVLTDIQAGIAEIKAFLKRLEASADLTQRHFKAIHEADELFAKRQARLLDDVARLGGPVGVERSEALTMAALAERQAALAERMDRFDERLRRIERSLDLVEDPTP